MEIEIRHILVLPELLEKLAREALAWLQRDAAASASDPVARDRSSDEAWLTRHGLADLMETAPVAPPAAVLERVEATLGGAPSEPAAAEEPPPTLVWTLARSALLRRRWPSGEVSIEAVMAELNGLPGLPINGKQQVYNQASKLGLKRPIIRPEMKPAPAPAVAEAKPPPVAVKRPPVRFAHEQAAPTLPPPVAPPPLKTGAQVKREAEQAEVARFIATKGVKRCPTAVLEVTTAMVPEEERRAIATHDAALEQRRLDDHMARTARGRSFKARQAPAQAAG